MEFKVVQKNSNKKGLIEKFTLVLFGIFISSLIFALSINIFGDDKSSLYIGLAINIIAAAGALYHSKKSSFLRLAGYGIAGTVIIGTILFIIALSSINALLEGL